MTIEQVTRLLDAGFTKDEIVSFSQGETVAPAAPAEPEKKEPEPEEPKTETVENVVVPTVADDKKDMSELNKRLDGIENSISEMIKSFHTTNLLHDSFGSMPDSLEEQTDKIMACIIRPETERK